MFEQLSPQDLTAYLSSLRAVRRFAPMPVPDEVIRSILEVGRWTGSAKNSQPWEFLVVRNRATLEELSTLGQFAGHLAGASFAVLLVMRSRLNQLDAGRVAERLMLAAWAHDVGSCIGSLFPDENEAKAKTMLDVPPEREMRTAISFGYLADAQATRLSSTPGLAGIPLGRKPLSEIAHFDRYRKA
jgi:nitroreductase